MSSSPRGAIISRVPFYTWLGAGAMTLGVGAALASGSGVAHADSATVNDASQSATSAVTKGHRQSPARPYAKPQRAQSITATADSSPENLVASLVKTSAAPDSLRDPTTNVKAAINAASSRRSLAHKPKPYSAVRAEVVANSLVARAATAAPGSTSVGRRPTASAEALTTKDELDLYFNGFNNSIGWVPGVGTAVNGFKLAVDVVSLASSIITLNVPQLTTELGNIVVDIIGLVPVVGAPVASLIYETALGGNAKLGRWVQQSMQGIFDVDSTWSRYQFRIDAVDVSPGVFGAYSGTATVSTASQPGVGVMVDITNNGFGIGWSVPLEGRLALLGLGLSSGGFFS